jgi:Family of unknown function (DUF5754)
MEYYIPIASDSPHHKFDVRIWNPISHKDQIVHFGDPAFEDYTQHHDEKRRQNYLMRSSGIRDGNGKLTKDNPLSANYWSRRYLWASEEPWYVYLPPTLKKEEFDVGTIFI